ncbi:MAG: phage portal protein [Alphaproteobacteria bacterium]
MALRNWLGGLAKQPAVKSSAAGPLIAWSQIGRAKWTPRRYDALAEEGFRKNVVAYRCISMVAGAAAQIPWLLYDGEGRELTSHPLLQILEQPNPLMDGVSFRENLFAAYQIAGNVYIEAVRPDSGAPRELYPLRSDRMRVVPGPTGFPQGYEYQAGGQTMRWNADPLTGASNILHVRHYHPLDDWYGLAPLEAALLAIDQHNAAGGWNQALLNNGARPSGALVFAPKEGPAHLSEEQVRRLKDQLDEYYQGARNAGKPMLLEGGLDWRPMSLSPQDMDWLKGRDAAARDIALAFGVPSQLVGLPDAQTYANIKEARLAFYEETVLPLAMRFVASFNHWIAPMFGDGLVLDLDLDEVSALAQRREAVWEKLQRVDFLTINEKRDAAGYGPLADGDRLVFSAAPLSAPSSSSITERGSP